MLIKEASPFGGNLAGADDSACGFVYVPIVAADPSDIGNAFKYLVDTLLLSGTLLALAGALSVCVRTRKFSPAGTAECSPCMTASSPVKAFFLKRDRESLWWSGRCQGRRSLAFISTLDTQILATSQLALG